MDLHAKFGGKLFTGVPFEINDRDALSTAYTPGVAEPCRVIARNPERVFDLTIKSHTVAVVTDGSAILGLGDLGAMASIPVMEGKAALFKRFANVDAFPIALATNDVEEIVETVKRIAPVFGGINLEDISAPRCFEVERRLINELDIPVLHDDQHGTAIVVLAGLINAARVVGKSLDSLSVVISGAGAAGIAVSHTLHAAGVRDITVLDSKGVVVKGREGMNPYKEEVAVYNTQGRSGSLAEAIKGADVFIGVSAPGVLTADMVKTMNERAIVFAMSNPTPEIMPEEAKASGAACVATGRSDYPNQINNALAFPGLFKGALASHIPRFTSEMKVAAARAIAGLVPEPLFDKIVPSPFEPGLADAVAAAVSSSYATTRDA